MSDAQPFLPLTSDYRATGCCHYRLKFPRGKLESQRKPFQFGRPKRLRRKKTDKAICCPAVSAANDFTI